MALCQLRQCESGKDFPPSFWLLRMEKGLFVLHFVTVSILLSFILKLMNSVKGKKKIMK